LHTASQTPTPYKLFISERKIEVVSYTEGLRRVRLWNQLSGNGQRDRA